GILRSVLVLTVSVFLIFPWLACGQASLQYTVIDLGTLGGSMSAAQVINDPGQITGISQISDGTSDAFLYDGNTMIDLGKFGGSSSNGVNINNGGAITGEYTDDIRNFDHAFLYSHGTFTDLGTLGGRNSYGRGINDRGEVVGASQMAQGPDHGFLYSH